jgi:hypothetical protein
MPAPLLTALSEMDKLKLQLAKEKASRLQSEMMNLQMVQRQVQGQLQAQEAENKVLFDRLKAEYQLAPADEIGEDGVIKRSPVRSLPAAPPKEG